MFKEPNLFKSDVFPQFRLSKTTAWQFDVLDEEKTSLPQKRSGFGSTAEFLLLGHKEGHGSRYAKNEVFKLMEFRVFQYY